MANKTGNKDSSMSAHLKAMGYPHGKTATYTACPPIPKMSDVGSAAYRRRVGKGRA